jgi:hypothetical protein
VTGEGSDTSAENDKKSKRDSTDTKTKPKWQRRLSVVVAAIGFIGAVFSIGGTAGHWFAGLTSNPTCGMSTASQIARSPNLGISFHQDNQVALMTYINEGTLQTPVIGVCLSSAPFEIWFPALGPQSDVQVCTSNTDAIFRVNPFPTGACLGDGSGAADYSYASGTLFETGLTNGEHTEIAQTRAQPASGGDEMYFVSTLWSPAKSLSENGKPFSITKQSANLYLVIYAPHNYNEPPSDALVEHYILRFK